jgi:phage shock protein PspC (stress-responsive transcriptional regulator)
VFPIVGPSSRLYVGAMNTTSDNPEAENQTPPRALRRPIHDRMLAGVAAGLANYFDVDVTAVRVALAVLAVVGGAGVAIYIAGWLLMPEEGSEQSIASEFIRSRQAGSH